MLCSFLCLFVQYLPSTSPGHGFPECADVGDADAVSVLPLPRCLLGACLHPLRPQLLLHLHHLAMGWRPRRKLSQMSEGVWDPPRALRKLLCQGDVGADQGQKAEWHGIAGKKAHLLRCVHGKTNQGSEIVPRLSHLVLSESPGASPQGGDAEDSQADWAGGNSGNADLQKAPTAPGAVLSKWPQVCVCAVHGEWAHGARHHPSGAREPREEGDPKASFPFRHWINLVTGS